MNDKERENQIILAWAIRWGIATQYEDLDKPLTKREFLRIIYKLCNKMLGGNKENERF